MWAAAVRKTIHCLFGRDAGDIASTAFYSELYDVSSNVLSMGAHFFAQRRSRFYCADVWCCKMAERGVKKFLHLQLPAQIFHAICR